MEVEEKEGNKGKACPFWRRKSARVAVFASFAVLSRRQRKKITDSRFSHASAPPANPLSTNRAGINVYDRPTVRDWDRRSRKRERACVFGNLVIRFSTAERTPLDVPTFVVNRAASVLLLLRYVQRSGIAAALTSSLSRCNREENQKKKGMQRVRTRDAESTKPHVQFRRPTTAAEKATSKASQFASSSKSHSLLTSPIAQLRFSKQRKREKTSTSGQGRVARQEGEREKEEEDRRRLELSWEPFCAVSIRFLFFFALHSASSTTHPTLTPCSAAPRQTPSAQRRAPSD